MYSYMVMALKNFKRAQVTTRAKNKIDKEENRGSKITLSVQSLTR